MCCDGVFIARPANLMLHERISVRLVIQKVLAAIDTQKKILFPQLEEVLLGLLYSSLLRYQN